MATLDRRLITGPLDDRTPLCVLLEVARCHRVVYKDLSLLKNDPEAATTLHVAALREAVNAKSVYTLTNKETPRTEELGVIAWYINPDPSIEWELQELLEAFKKLQGYAKKIVISYNFVMGQLSPGKLGLVPCSVLYRFCRDRYPPETFRRKTTDVELVMLARSALVPSPTLRYFALHEPRHKYYALITRGEWSWPKRKLDLEEVTKVIRSYLTERKAGKEEPATAEDAVARIAICYSLDFTRSTNALFEWYHLSEHISRKGRPQDYIPQEALLAKIKNEKPDLLDLDRGFCPVMPIEFYPKDSLRKWALSEGWDPGPREGLIQNAYEFLHMTRLSNNFYHPSRCYEESVTELEFSKVGLNGVPEEDYVYYGLYRGPKIAIEIETLHNSFKHHRRFVCGYFGSELYSPLAIECLYRMLEVNGTELASRMRNLICTIRDWLDIRSSVVEEFLESHKNGSKQLKEYDIKALWYIFESGFYMRGWLGPGQPYPLQPGMMDEDLAGIKVHESMKRLDDLTISMNMESRRAEIYKLPIVRYKDRKFEDPGEDDGLTIGDRLNIVAEGVHTENMLSCIRMSSNWFIGCSYRYLTYLDQDMPFPIYDLGHAFG